MDRRIFLQAIGSVVALFGVKKPVVAAVEASLDDNPNNLPVVNFDENGKILNGTELMEGRSVTNRWLESRKIGVAQRRKQNFFWKHLLRRNDTAGKIELLEWLWLSRLVLWIISYSEFQKRTFGSRYVRL